MTKLDELKAHIERWAMWPDQKHARKLGREYCIICEFAWPCPTAVVKGWKE